MRQRHVFLAILALTALSSSSARADIIEVKNKGFLNGTIVAETDDTMKLRDVDGNLLTFPKADVTYVEREAVQPVKSTSEPAAPPPKAEKKKEPEETKKTKKKPKKSGLENYFQSMKDARDEQNQKIEFDRQILEHNYEMEEHQRAVLNQIHPGTFPDSPPDTSSFEDGTWKDTRTPDSPPRKRGNFSKLL